MIWSTVLPMRGVPKGRPRFWRGRVLTPLVTRAAEHNAEMLIKASVPYKFSGPIAVSLTFEFKRPRQTKYEYPKRGDLDNYVKLITDSMNGLLYDDDDQIVAINAVKKYGDDDQIYIQVKLAKDTLSL